jgi:hypothetical protein
VRLALAALVAAAALATPAAAAADSSCNGSLPGATPPRPSGAPLRFGIYPGGVAGQLVVPASPKPESQARIDAALAQLRAPGWPFVVHLYRSYRDDSSDAAEEQDAQRLVDRYTAAGYQVEYVLRYRRDGDVPGFTRFVRGVVDRFGSKLAAIQVTNEVNFPVSDDSSDGVHAGAEDALIQGVIAAKDEARMRGDGRLEVGFNWFYRTDPDSEHKFWQYLWDHGGQPFVSSLDYVGLDAYPGTFFPPAGPSTNDADAMVNAFSVLRECFLPVAHIPASVPIHVLENGWPTGPGRSDADQQSALESMVGATSAYRGKYNVTDYRWFDLRDADSSSPNFQQQFGLTRDDYTPKPAFAAYARLVRELGAAAAPPAPAGSSARRGGLTLNVRCYRRGVRASVRGPGIRSVAFRVRDRTVTDRHAPFRRSIRLRRAAVALGVRALATLESGGTVRLRRRGPDCGASSQ